MLTRRIAALAALLLLHLFPAAANSTVPEGILDDFKPLSGYVIKPVEGEYLIDLDASRGLTVGDLVSVVVPGEKIVHPVTNEVLGTLDEVKGVLRVSRIKSGYSYAAPVGQSAGIEAGDVIRRYEQIPAYFLDHTGGGEPIYAELRKALPALEWQGYAEVGNGHAAPSGKHDPALLFVLDADGLEVRDSAGNVIHAYAVPSDRATEIQPPPGRGMAAPSSPAIERNRVESKSIIRRPEPSSEGFWFSNNLSGVVVGVAVADLDGDDRMEIATLFGDRVEVAEKRDDEYRREAVVELGVGPKPLALDSADLNGDGRSELFVTAADRDTMRSLRIGFDGEDYRIEERGIGWYFRTVELPGEGRVLLAQRLGTRGQDFSGEVFRVASADGKLKEGAPVDLPAEVSIYGFVPFADERGEHLIALIDQDDRLKVLRSDGTLLWEGDGHFGGSETFVERIDPTKNPADGDMTRYAYLQKRIERGAQGELLIPVNEGSRLFNRRKALKSSRLVAMAWNGHSLEELWHTREQKGRLADFRMADADNDGFPELVQALVFTRKGWDTEGRSALMAVELP